MRRAKAKKLNRRQFMRGAAAAVGAVVAIPTIIAPTALGRGGKVAPSDRIILGGIGIGRRGTHDLKWMLPESDVQFVADCDPQKSRAESVKQVVDTHYGNTDFKIYHNTPEFLAEVFRLPANGSVVVDAPDGVVIGQLAEVLPADRNDPDAEALATLPPISAWLGVIYFSVQILADFAGYSSIAIGLAYLMKFIMQPDLEEIILLLILKMKW